MTRPSRGSSPLTRGKRRLRRGRAQRHGLIPAHAGKTRGATNDARRRGAHPRSRGENTFAAPMMFLTWGSSPLTRGKRRQDTRRARCAGLIPAHAGKTIKRRTACDTSKAHPRSRGENARSRRCAGATWGSSPLTRGKLAGGSAETYKQGLIPAHAGKTASREDRFALAGAHPRSRGENDLTEPIIELMPGSSPLTRGKLSFRWGWVVRVRLIPAHAGKTRSDHGRRDRSRAHPRSRGENRMRRVRSFQRRGSSPLTRGKRSSQVDMRSSRGLIPAHAGKTRRSDPRSPHPKAHPRSRGENMAKPGEDMQATGSSPLTRGKQGTLGPELR